MITAQLPDGTSLQFPDDTPQDVIQGVVRKQLGVQPQKFTGQPSDPRNTGMGRTVVDQGMQGLTGSFGDEVSDALGAGIAKVYGMATGNNDSTLSQLYDEARQNTKQRLSAQFKENPATSIAAQIGGGALLGGAALSGLKAAAPASGAALEAYAQANPYRTALGTGIASGALYGAGSGEGGIAERVPDALLGGVVGAVAGPMGAYIGRNALAPIAERIGGSRPVQAIADRLTPERPPNTPVLTPEQSAMISGDVSPNLRRIEGDIFSKTGGQRLQDANLQRLENDARAGTLTPTAEKAVRNADIQQNREFTSYMDRLANGLDKGADPNVLVEGVADVVKTNAKTAKAGVNSAYDLAREGKGVKLRSQEIRQGLWKGLAEIRRNNVYDLSQMPKAKSVIKRLATYSKLSPESPISAIKLGELENWRKQATNALASTQDPTEKKFLGEMVRGYDSFMEKTAEDAVDIGDANAIRAFREAVGKRREYGRLFESNKIIGEILGGEKSIDDTVKSLMGTGSIKGKKEMASNLDAILKASGKEADNVQNDLKQAFTLNMFRKSVNGYEPNNPNMERISPAKLKTELENLFVHQSAFAEKLYGKEIVRSAKQAIKELDLISTSQAGVRNPSGSGEWLGRFLSAPGVNRIPGTGLIGKAIDAQKQHAGGAQVIKGLDEFITEQSKPTSTIWAIAAPVGATSVTNKEKK